MVTLGEKYGEVRKLDGLGRLVMGFDVQDAMFCEFFPLNTVVSRKVICCSMYPLTI